MVRWAATDAGLISELAGVVVMTGVTIGLCIGYSLWLARVMRRSAATQRDALYRLVADHGVRVGGRLRHRGRYDPGLLA